MGFAGEAGELREQPGRHERQIARDHQDARALRFDERRVDPAERARVRQAIGHDTQAKTLERRRVARHDEDRVGHAGKRVELAFEDRGVTDAQRALVGASETAGPASRKDCRIHSRSYLSRK